MTYEIYQKKGFSLQNINNFLVRNNWILDDTYNNIVQIWHRPNTENKYSIEILVPLKTELKDYHSVMKKTLTTLQNYYKCSLSKLFTAINGFLEDKISIQIIHDDLGDGTIPIEDGALLVENAKSMMITAAQTTIRRRRNILGKLPQKVQEFSEKIRLGQTEIGSYIINIHAPIKPEEGVLIQGVPFERKVTEQLITSIETLIESIEMYESNSDIEIFDLAVEKGVSSNICKEIIEFSGNRRNHDINIIFEMQKEIDQENDSKSILIERNKIDTIQIAYNYLIQKREYEGYELEGYVTRLSRNEHDHEGYITIISVIEEKQRSVSAYLNEQYYLIAIICHRDQIKINIIGDLIVETRRAEIINITSVTIAENNDLSLI